MTITMNYPKCANTFLQFCMSNKNYKYIYNSIGRPIPFDVSLRDGLQGLSKVDQINYNLQNKIKLFNDILYNNNPKNMEIGSCINQKILPIFKDTESLFYYAKKNNPYEIKNYYILVPNEEQLLNALKIGCKNLSFIYSVSNSFQYKNTRMSLDDKYLIIKNMLEIIDDYSNIKIDDNFEYINYDFTPFKTKLYISCINECPIEGKISNSKIIENIMKMYKLKFNKICLSDTCGTLSLDCFKGIINEINKNGLDKSLFSLHLHVNKNRENEVEQIIHEALDNGITEFDVSALETGGCSVTMEKSKLAPNLTYELYYKFLCNYIINKCNEKNKI